jgi:hypothetical protein
MQKFNKRLRHLEFPMLSNLGSVNDLARSSTWIITTSFVETATARFLLIQTRAQHPSHRLEAGLQRRSAEPSLGWPECRLPTSRDGWLALAAKVCIPPLVLIPTSTSSVFRTCSESSPICLRVILNTYSITKVCTRQSL